MSLFANVDANGDGKLHKEEMRSLADLVGFEGSDEEWTEEYEKLCSEHGVVPAHGIPEHIVMQLLEDRSESGCYCTTEELHALLGDLQGEDGDVSTRLPSPDADSRPSAKANAQERVLSSCTVFFASANFDTEAEVLRSTFEEAGNILDFRLFRMPDGRSRGMGRVKFSTPEEARKAVLVLNQQMVDGRKLVVKVDNKGDDDGAAGGRRGRGSGSAKGARSRAANNGAQPGVGKSSPNKIFAGGRAAAAVGPAADAGPRIGAAIGSRAAAASAVGSRAPDYHTLPPSSAPVVGKGPPVGSRAAADGGKDPLGGKALWGKGTSGQGCMRGGSAPGQEPGAYERGPNHWEGPEQVHGNNTVFFTGASFETPAASLRRRFEEIGKVDQFWLFTLKDGRSRGMGVVQYSTAKEARHAVKMIDGTMVGGRELLVKVDNVGVLQAAEEDENFDDGLLGKGAMRDVAGSHWDGAGAYEQPWNTFWKGGKDSISGKGWDFGGGGSSSSKGHSSKGGGRKVGFGGLVGSDRVLFFGAPANLSYDVLRDYFSHVGEVRFFSLFRLPDGRSRGKGVCTFASPDVAAWALRQGVIIEGRPLYLQEDTSQTTEGGKGSELRGKGLATFGGKQGKGQRAPAYEDYSEAYGYFDDDYPCRDSFEGWAQGEGAYDDGYPGPYDDGGFRGSYGGAYPSSHSSAPRGRSGSVVSGVPAGDPVMDRNKGAYDDGYRCSYGGAYPSSHSGGARGCAGAAASGAPDDPVTDTNKAVYFANVPFGTTESHLRKMFASVGQIKTFQLYTTQDGRSRGMGFVEYTTEASAERAYYELHATEVSGRSIIVDAYRAAEPRAAPRPVF